METCVYTEKKSDGYGTDWRTACGEQMRCESPIEVGICFPPKPNAYGKYCHYCGKQIVLKEKING